MLFRTHLSFSFLIVLILFSFFSFSNNILFLMVFLLFSLLPDMDHYSSKINKKMQPLGFIINLIFGHRGIFHTIYFPLALSVFLVTINLKFYALAVFLGYISHLALDALTIKGIRPLYPLIKKRIHGFIKVDSFLENLLFLILIVLVIYYLI